MKVEYGKHFKVKVSRYTDEDFDSANNTVERRKYTSKDFGFKSIPYGESDETEADGLPAYQEELAHIKNVLCRTAEKFSLDKDCTRITKMSLSDEWVSLYNHDEKEGKLTVEIEVAVNATFELQFKKPSKNENKEANVIDDRLLCVLNEFSVLAHGHAMCNYWNYETQEYDPYGVPDEWNIKSYSDDMDEIVNCPHCEKKSNFWQLLYKQRNPHTSRVRLRCLRKLLQHRTSHRKQMEK